MTWVYRKTYSSLWTVGFYDPKGEWIPESDHETAEAATRRVNYLNGGADINALYAAAMYIRS